MVVGVVVSDNRKELPYSFLLFSLLYYHAQAEAGIGVYSGGIYPNKNCINVSINHSFSYQYVNIMQARC